MSFPDPMATLGRQGQSAKRRGARSDRPLAQMAAASASPSAGSPCAGDEATNPDAATALLGAVALREANIQD